MSGGTAQALAVVRVKRGHAPPTEEDARAAIARDRARLHLPPEKYRGDVSVAGPYAITVDGQELDEYVVWER
ncbi:MAG: hypothetical protein ACE5I7_04905 [Candidatus Binatia bacterium]